MDLIHKITRQKKGIVIWENKDVGVYHWSFCNTNNSPYVYEEYALIASYDRDVSLIKTKTVENVLEYLKNNSYDLFLWKYEDDPSVIHGLTVPGIVYLFQAEERYITIIIPFGWK